MKSQSKKKTNTKKTNRILKKKSTPVWWKDKQNRSLLIIILVATFLCYLPTFQNDFVNWDDPDYVLENPLVFQINGETLKGIFTEIVSYNYHPLTVLSLAIDYSIDGANAKVFHTTNLIFHLLNCVLVFLFIFRLTKGKSMVAFISALLFAIHPMHVESVAWVTERKDLLYTFFFLLALLQYLKYIRSNQKKSYWLAFAWALCSFLSKPAAMTLPLVLPLLDYFEGRKFNMKVWLEKVPFLLLAIGFGVLTYLIQNESAVRSFEEIPLFKRFFFAGYAFNVYLFKFFLPLKLSALHAYPAFYEISGIFYAMPVIALSILGAGYYYFKNNKAVIFGFLFFLLTISITLQLVSFGAAIYSERYSYLPYIGLGFLIGILYQHLIDKKKGKPILVRGLFAAFSLLLCVFCWQQVKIWKNGETLWTQVIENSDRMVSPAYKNRGTYYKSIGEIQKAIIDLEKARGIDPAGLDARLALANIYYEEGNHQRALSEYNEILAVDPNKESVLTSRSVVLSLSGRNEEAIIDLNKVIKNNPRSLNAIKNRATIYFNTQRYDLALVDYLAYHKLDPDEVDIINAIVTSNQGIGDYAAALEYANLAISKAPNTNIFYYNRALCNRQLGNNAAARQDALKAQQLGYQLPQGFLESLN